MTPQQADVAVGKGVSNATPNVGDTTQYNGIAGNFGPDTATKVTVTDLLPTGLTFISATPTQGAYNAATGLWTVGTIPADAAPTLTITARVASPEPVTNTASVSHSDQFDPDLGNKH